MFEVISAQAPTFTEDGKCISLLVTFDKLGEIPFTASPDDVEEHGRRIYADALEGKYGAITPYMPPEVPYEQAAAHARAWRDSEVSATQWLVERHRDEITTTLSAAQFTELQVYRQALRDWPVAVGFPEGSTKPEAPVWLAAEIGS